MAATGNATIQLAVPDGLRGRVMSVYTTVFSASIPIGGLVMGAHRLGVRDPDGDRDRRRPVAASSGSGRSSGVAGGAVRHRSTAPAPADRGWRHGPAAARTPR